MGLLLLLPLAVLARFVENLGERTPGSSAEVADSPEEFLLLLSATGGCVQLTSAGAMAERLSFTELVETVATAGEERFMHVRRWTCNPRPPLQAFSHRWHTTSTIWRCPVPHEAPGL